AHCLAQDCGEKCRGQFGAANRRRCCLRPRNYDLFSNIDSHNDEIMRVNKRANYGPWLVGLGAALWGTESAWRIPLNNLFDARVIVFWEHVLIFVGFLPLLLSQARKLPKVGARTWGFLIFSGFAGSAVGTIFFTLALKEANPTVVNVILNIQPVI